MVRASHVIFSAYGFWLPNDPRGSWSEFVGSWELFQHGPATKTSSRRSVAQRAHDQQQRRTAKGALKRPPVIFDGPQALAIANGFQFVVDRDELTIHACAVLPDHVHLVIRRHERTVEQIVTRLKAGATKRLLLEHRHPFQDGSEPSGKVPQMWATGHWKVFLNSDSDIQRAIAYVEENPVKDGKRQQRWSFVTPFETDAR